MLTTGPSDEIYFIPSRILSIKDGTSTAVIFIFFVHLVVIAPIRMLISLVFIGTILLYDAQGAINLFYPSNITEESCSGNRGWTMWFNVGKPKNATSGDSEDMSIILAQNPKTLCRIPSGIQAQSINYRTGGWSIQWQWKQPDITLYLLSFYSFAPGGVDFQVRYCCPIGSFAGTTTTTTTPLPLDSNTCGKQQIAPRSNTLSRIFGGTDAIANSWPWVSIKSLLYLVYSFVYVLRR
jgi:hypothetical protein